MTQPPELVPPEDNKGEAEKRRPHRNAEHALSEGVGVAQHGAGEVSEVRPQKRYPALGQHVAHQVKRHTGRERWGEPSRADVVHTRPRGDTASREADQPVAKRRGSENPEEQCQQEPKENCASTRPRSYRQAKRTGSGDC